MTSHYYIEFSSLRQEIAAGAARLIAEEGASYDLAKRKAAKQILGNKRVSGDILPNNDEVEEEVRIYNALFLSDSQPARLLYLRQLALSVMEMLQDFNPYITGAVLNGTGGEHSDIHLQLFTENVKDVQIFLLNKQINFSVSESPHSRHRSQIIETIHFIWHDEAIHLTVYAPDDIRKIFKSSGVNYERASIIELVSIIEEQVNFTPQEDL